MRIRIITRHLFSRTVLPGLFALMALCIINSRQAFSQTAEADSAHAWKSNLEISLTGAQAGFENWVEGGTNSLAGNLGLD